MRTLLYTFLVLTGLSFAPTIAAAGAVEMIFWENQSWESNGGSGRLTLWADGRSEIVLTEHFAPSDMERLNPGWQVRGKLPTLEYYLTNPLPKETAKQKFAAALAAGIRDLKTFPAGYNDGSGTLVGVQVDGKVKETVIPMFLHEGEPDNKGSDNEKRFLAVKKAIGDFNTNALQ